MVETGKPDWGDVAALLGAAFDRVSVAALRRAVMTEALEDANLFELPKRVEELTFFVSGPLYERAHHAMGPEFADSLLREFAPILDDAWERDRARSYGPVSSGSYCVDADAANSRKGTRSSVWKVLDDADPDSARDTVPAPAPGEVGSAQVNTPEVATGRGSSRH